MSVLNFVDLAGSERQSQTGAEGSRLKEGTFINKSLLNLGIVIAKLSEQSHKPSGVAAGGGGGSDGMVPFRDSKLTHILSSSLGGNSRVCVVCCVSAAVVNCEHSVSTLRFGSRCARVRQTVKVNEVSGDAAEINRYEGKIKQLQNRLSVLPAHSQHSVTASAASAAEAAKARREAEREDREEKEAMWEQRRLLAEDRMKIEEERVRLEEQITLPFIPPIALSTMSRTHPSYNSAVLDVDGYKRSHWNVSALLSGTAAVDVADDMLALGCAAYGSSWDGSSDLRCLA